MTRRRHHRRCSRRIPSPVSVPKPSSHVRRAARLCSPALYRRPDQRALTASCISAGDYERLQQQSQRTMMCSSTSSYGDSNTVPGALNSFCGQNAAALIHQIHQHQREAQRHQQAAAAAVSTPFNMSVIQALIDNDDMRILERVRMAADPTASGEEESPMPPPTTLRLSPPQQLPPSAWSPLC